ncbi:MAG: hypothetical protein ACTS85_02160 [Arsenophonus sp. NC-PG7-MAG3]
MRDFLVPESYDSANKPLDILLAMFSTYPETMKKLEKERKETAGILRLSISQLCAWGVPPSR